MIIVRPVARHDIDQLIHLAKKVAPGITTFPANNDVLLQKIEGSISGFSETPSDDKSNTYLMVLEQTDPLTQKSTIMGTSAVYANIGRDIPFYTFKILKRTQHNDDLDIHVMSRSLHLVNEYTGETEIGTLILDPGYRGGGYGKLLAKCRYMLIAQFKERFAARIFAELRGWSDKTATSPFWESVGKHFFAGMSYQQADYLSATTNNQFIADLMPVHPIYCDLLPNNAIEVIGKPHPTGEPALKMLFNEGFRYEDFIDIFDAGPTVHAQQNDIKTIRDSKLYKLGTTSDKAGSNEHYIICNTSLKNFRVCQSSAKIVNAEIILDQQLADSLLISAGDFVRVFRI